jgi:hypothetical protein
MDQWLQCPAITSSSLKVLRLLRDDNGVWRLLRLAVPPPRRLSQGADWVVGRRLIQRGLPGGRNNMTVGAAGNRVAQ